MTTLRRILLLSKQEAPAAARSLTKSKKITEEDVNEPPKGTQKNKHSGRKREKDDVSVRDREKERSKSAEAENHVSTGGQKRKRPLSSTSFDEKDTSSRRSNDSKEKDTLAKKEKVGKADDGAGDKDAPREQPKSEEKEKDVADKSKNKQAKLSPVHKKSKQKPAAVNVESQVDTNDRSKGSSPRHNRAMERTRLRSPRLASLRGEKVEAGDDKKEKEQNFVPTDKKRNRDDSFKSETKKETSKALDESKEEKKSSASVKTEKPKPKINDTTVKKQAKEINKGTEALTDESKTPSEDNKQKVHTIKGLQKSKSSDSLSSEATKSKGSNAQGGNKRKRRSAEDALLQESNESKLGTKPEHKGPGRPPKRNASKNCPGNTLDKESLTSPSNANSHKEKDNKRKLETSQPEKSSRPRKNGKGKPEEKIEWVECERCKKWTSLPPSRSVKSLPDHWYCEMNTWDPKAASCSGPKSGPKSDKSKKPSVNANVSKSDKSKSLASGLRSPEDKDQTAAVDESEKDTSHTKSVKKKQPGRHRMVGRGRATRHNPERERNTGSGNRPRINSSMSAPISDAGKKKQAAKESSWVRCDTCHQWRKLPPHVNTEALPENWYCHMNKWDPARAQCSAPQEADDTKAETTVVATTNSFVKLPEGASLYGNNVWPVGRGNRAPPGNYRELIVGHYRHFKQWEITTSRILNDRYRDSSVYIPQDISRLKSSKHHGRRSSNSVKSEAKLLEIARAQAKCVSRDAVENKSLFYRLLLDKPKQKGNTDESIPLKEKTASGKVGVLKFFKPLRDHL